MIPKTKKILENSFIEIKLPRFLNAKRQITIKDTIFFNGMGLHTGKKVNMTLNPAPPNTGIVFRKKLKDKIVEIKSNFHNVESTKLCTVLSDFNGNKISTVEHILSALYAYEIDNIFVDVDSEEIPVYDGSSLEFVKKLDRTNFDEQDSYKKFIKIKKNVEIRVDEKIARVSPFDNTLITTEVDYDHKVIGKQSISLLLNPEIYKTQICSARTFGFLKDVEKLRNSGLALGGSLNNAIVLDEEKVLNPEGLRYTDEFVRHKLLDFIGDISLSGHRILGSFFSSHPGHDLNFKLLKKIFESQDNWELFCSN